MYLDISWGCLDWAPVSPAKIGHAKKLASNFTAKISPTHGRRNRTELKELVEAYASWQGRVRVI